MGEVCSPDVTGLAFDTGRPWLSPAGALAVGGVETVRVLELGPNGAAPSIGDPSTIRMFTAVSSAPSIMELTQIGSSVRVVGSTEGTARLRILDAGGRLLDSLPIAIRAVASERLTDGASRIVAPSDSIDALLEGSAIRARFGLFDADGGELWDESVRYEALPDVATAPEIVIDVSRESGPRHFVVPVVAESEIDGIVAGVGTLEAELGFPGYVVDATHGIDLHIVPTEDPEPAIVCVLGNSTRGVVAGLPLLATTDPAIVSLEASSVGCLSIAPSPSFDDTVLRETDITLMSLGHEASIHVRVHPSTGSASALVSPAAASYVAPDPHAVRGERAG